MKKLLFLMLAATMVVFGSEAWEAIVMPKASLLMYCGEKMIERGEDKEKHEKEGKMDKLEEMLGSDTERAEYYEALLEVLDEIGKAPAMKKNGKTFRMCDSFAVQKNASVAIEFKNPVAIEALKSIPDAELTITVDKIAEKEALSFETQGDKKARFAAIIVDEGKTMLLTGWDNAAALVARIGKAAQYTAEMKYLVDAAKGDFRLCMEMTQKLKQKLNEKAMGQMSVEPVQAMALMKLAEMNGVLVDSTITAEGVIIKLGLSSVSAQAASVVKDQLFDGMVMPMAQSLADSIAPGKINTAGMLKTSVSGKLAILNITLKNSDLELFDSLK